MAERNYYTILNVKHNAGAAEIKAAYRALAKKYHPDKNLGNKSAEEYFKLVQEAYTVLSDPVKRRKYDLSFQSSSSYSSQRTYTAYSGNAYQYAQQQAQQRAQPHYQRKAPSKPDKSEKYGILISVSIAFVLLYFIISYTSGPPAPKNDPAVSPTCDSATDDHSTEKEQPANSNKTIGEFDSPYTAFFGPEISDREARNNITFSNGSESEAVVCLIRENEPSSLIIRNQYMNTGAVFKMNNIPDGNYSIRIYYGRDWDPDKGFSIMNVKGGFSKEFGFVKMNAGKNALLMKQEKKGNLTSYSTYDVLLYPYDLKKEELISEEEFFKK